MIVNIGRFESTVSHAFIKHFKSKGLNVGLNYYFQNTVTIDGIVYTLKDYRVNQNNNIIVILKWINQKALTW